ncbi:MULTISPECIES: hypothetical protein [unclassified Leclercia]|uniref:Uncharacterized protein n=1 Tax=Leclercia barmai TaxID=2785629 RepID=A0ABS7RZ98_9ENTR|nr:MULTISPECIES: hypothetical protein [unclassified Leclercia]MBZ0059610.1 hypothetical protein [Leclercia sp. EMC7]MCM5697257.1 hypothetical protein [Leclercia sp. LTM01]MCM5702147.1 hypothetical protein [Leclercia sp. LTM14]
MSLLTHEASQAIEWLRVHIPNCYWEQFRDEMEMAMSEVLKRYGLDKELFEGLSVDRLIARRLPLIPNNLPAPAFTSVRATVYQGDSGVWALDGKGNTWEQNGFGGWLPSSLTLEQVKIKSTTYNTEVIKVMTRDSD